MSTGWSLERLASLPMVDHHCHGVVSTDLDTAQFEAYLSEAGAPQPGETNFDTPLGLAVRRHCAPILDLEPHAAPAAYLARRGELGAVEVNRRLLAGNTGTRFCVDTGFRGSALTTPEELAAIAAGSAHHVVRLETVAEQVAETGVDAAEFAAGFAERLHAWVTGVNAVGVKSIAAYRVGLDLDPTVPSEAEVTNAAARWLAQGPRPDGQWRLDDPVLIRSALAEAVGLGLPIQFHIGYGDADIRMHRADPSLLTDWLTTHRVPVMLLHCWPFHRQASYLSAVHPHVYLDVGLALHYVGPTRAAAVLAEAAELAPFTRLLYSSDAFGLAELYHLGLSTFRTALADLLDRRVAGGEWSAADADRIAGLVCAGNATRVYGLPR